MIQRIFKSTIFSYLFTIILFAILSLILTFSNLSDSFIPTAVVIISIVSILLGSSLASLNSRSHGWLMGLLVGLSYFFILYFISSLLISGFSINLTTIYLALGMAFTGIIGGIIGINRKKH